MMLTAAGLLPLLHDGHDMFLPERSVTPDHRPGVGGGRADVVPAERLGRLLSRARVPLRSVFDSADFQTAWAERFPAAAAWLLRGYAVKPPAYVREDLAERGADGTGT